MKLFCLHILKLTFLVIISLYALDLLYSKVYRNSKYRNKIQYAINETPKEYDVVFLGSSRANNHFVSSEFEKVGLKSFNFGISGGTLEDALLLLEILVDKKIEIKNLVLEVDLNIQREDFSEGTRAMFMPYLNSNLIVNNFYKSQIEEYKTYSNFPFYRFIKYDTKIGLREIIFSTINKKSTFLENKGYSPLFGTKREMSIDLSNVQPKKNKYYEKVKLICLQNNIKLIAVTTPICENTKGLDYFVKVKQLYPEIHNFENVITDDKYFSSCGHLNDEGAKKFTRVLMDSLKFN